MKIESPTPPMSSCASENSNESDGYFSEVFDQESTSDEVCFHLVVVASCNIIVVVLFVK